MITSSSEHTQLAIDDVHQQHAIAASFLMLLFLPTFLLLPTPTVVIATAANLTATAANCTAAVTKLDIIAAVV